MPLDSNCSAVAAGASKMNIKNLTRFIVFVCSFSKAPSRLL